MEEEEGEKERERDGGRRKERKKGRKEGRKAAQLRVVLYRLGYFKHTCVCYEGDYFI